MFRLGIQAFLGFLLLAGTALQATPVAKTGDMTQAVGRLAQAELSYNRAELQQSIDLFSRLTRETPRNAEYPYYLARAYFPMITLYEVSGDTSKAESIGEQGMEFAREAIRRDVNGNPDAYRLLGDYYGRLTNFKSIFGRMEYGGKSQKQHAKALEMDPKSMLAVIGVGTDKLLAPAGFGGDVDAAIQLFSKASQMSPESAIPLVWLARAYAKQGKPALAHSTLQRALQLQPGSAFVKNELEHPKA